jgi:hypothetical protein
MHSETGSGSRRLSKPAVTAVIAVGGVLTVALATGSWQQALPSAPVRSLSSTAPPAVMGGGQISGAPTGSAREAGERFLRGYVAFLYGRAGTAELKGATGDLRRGLRRSHRRVPPARAGRTPRVARFETYRQGATVVQITAIVDDGDVVPYPITAFVELRDGRWVVTHLADD